VRDHTEEEPTTIADAARSEEILHRLGDWHFALARLAAGML